MMLFLLVALGVVVLVAALVAAFRIVANDGARRPRPRPPEDPKDLGWHPALRSRPYSED